MPHSLASASKRGLALALCAALLSCGPEAPQLAVSADVSQRPEFAARASLVRAPQELIYAENPRGPMQARIARLAQRAQVMRRLKSNALYAKVSARRRASADIRAELRKSLQ